MDSILYIVRCMDSILYIWYMGSSILKTVSNIDILGVNFSSSGKYDDFINNRTQKCKRSMFALSGIGMSYPGLDTLNKVNLFKSICRPTLMYGVDCLNISKNNLKDIQSTQGFIMKHVCGLSKRAHHSDILKALDIALYGFNIIYSQVSLVWIQYLFPLS